MHRRTRRWLVQLTVAGLVIGGLAAPAAADTLSVSGQVTDRATGAPVAGACLTLFAAEAEAEVGTDCADEEGRYLLEGLAEGEYKLRARADGYIESWATDQPSWIGADRIILTPGFSPVVDMRLRAGQGGTVRGRYTDAAGEPFFVQVRVHHVSSFWTGLALTDPDGNWRMPNVPPGDYRVSFQNPTFFETRWAFGQTDPALATVFTVAAGGEVVVDDSAPATGSLEVTVVDAVTGAPVETACIRVTAPQDRQTCDSNGGVYTVEDLFPFSYQVTVVAGAAYELVEREGVVVTAGEVTRLTVPLTPTTAAGGFIIATVVDHATGSPIPSACAFLVDADGHGLTDRPFRTCAEPDGRLLFGPFETPQTFQLLAFDPNAGYGAQWLATWGGGTGDQRYAQRVTSVVGENVTTAPVRLRAAGTITGVVRDRATGAPVPGICAYPYAFDPTGGESGGPHCTGEDGRYTIAALGPYRWPVVFTNFGQQYAWQWSGGSPNRFTATRALVTPGSSVAVNAHLVPGARVTGRLLTADGQQPFGGSVAAFNATTGDYAGPGGTAFGDYELWAMDSQNLVIEYFIDTPDDPCTRQLRVTAGRTRTLDLVDCHGG